jgi:polar amino acid transport system substrate-binding protein
MSDETKARIFEPFFTTKEIGRGTWLGLAMAYGVVKQHNGIINVYSEEGSGTVFRVYLPLVKAEIETGERPVDSRPPVKRGNETLLFAEDDQSLRKLSTAVLREFGYTVIEAQDGEDAVRRFAENRERISLVILDVIMPKQNGRAAYEEISRMQPGTKVLFVSGYTADVTQQSGLLLKGLDFITKPVSPYDLLAKVREVLDRRAGQS